MNFAALPDLRAERSPDRVCIVDDESGLTNAQFAMAVRRAAATLHAKGVGVGDVVGVALPNITSLVVTLFAAWRLGAVVTPINPALTGPELEYQINDAAARLLIADAPPAAEPTATTFLPVDHLTSSSPLGDLSAEAATDELALLIYTSGTTGKPKGVMLSHGNLEAMARMMVAGFELNSDDHSLLVLPLFHVNGILASVLSPLLAGGRVTIAGRFSPKTFFTRLEESRATYFSAVPAIYTMLADLPAELRPDTTSVRFGVCGAAPASPELLERFQTRYRIPIIEGYGLSEGTCASTLNPLRGVRKPGTVGLPLPGQQVRIVDAEGRSLPQGEVGEVVITGPNVMRGYLNRPDETAQTIVEGWLHTGDLGRLDEDGYLILVDRAKDLIIRGGENIYPKEIEAAVYQLPGIAEAAVVGRRHPVYGEEPVLFVSLTPGTEIGVGRIEEHARASLAKYKQPAKITILGDLPKNPVGKIDKPTLRRQLHAR
ncbi:class I adenylate-forming enzyme family protein [Mycolicibacterium sp. XJ1819]